MIGRLLSVGLDTNPIIVDDSNNMSKYLEEQYLGMFIKYTDKNTTEYKKGYIYKVSQKQDGIDTVYFFAPYFYLETLDNPADSSRVLDGYQAYNDKGEKLEGQYKISGKVITANGTYYPADDNVNAYSKVTVNVAGETAENPYIATTDAEMNAYLAAEYKDSFVRMDYAKYHPTLPANATYDQAKFNYANIGIPRMCSYIDKWLAGGSEKVVLSLTITGGSGSAALTYYVKTKAYKFANTDGTYGYALGIEQSYLDDAGNETDNITTPAFLYHIKSGTIIDNWTADKDYDIGWTDFGGDADESTMDTENSIIQLVYQGRTGSYTVAIDDALVLTNMAGSEIDNKYVEGGVYKVTAQYNEINTYVAESPFQVGDQLAGATVYLNQQLSFEEFTKMCKDFVETHPDFDFGDYGTGTFGFTNVDYPLSPQTDEEYQSIWNNFAFLFSTNEQDGEQSWYNLYSYSASTDAHVLGKENAASEVKSPATPSSFTVSSTGIVIGGDMGVITAPATITKINFPTLLNAVAGKTANFYKKTVVETSYDFELQLPNGAYEEAQSETKLDAKITDDNIGKVYQYTGTTGNKYKNQSLYIIMED